MTSPALDRHKEQSASNSSSYTLTFPGPTGTVDAVFAVISTSHAPGTMITVSSITGGSLTFTQVGALQLANSIGFLAQAQDTNLEIWMAEVGASLAGSTVFTINLSGTAPACDAVMFSVTGVYSVASPLDNNAGLPATASNVSNTATATYSTSQADDLIIVATASPVATGLTAPAGWTTIDGPNSVTGTGNYCAELYVGYKSVSAVQTAQTVASTSGAGRGNQVMVIAITADAKTVAGQTFVTIICT